MKPLPLSTLQQGLALLQSATPGPWHVSATRHEIRQSRPPAPSEEPAPSLFRNAGDARPEDLALVIWMRAHLEALLAEAIEHRQAPVKSWRAETEEEMFS